MRMTFLAGGVLAGLVTLSCEGARPRVPRVAATAAGGKTVVVGVLSPSHIGRSIGDAHEETVLFALNESSSIEARGILVNLKPMSLSDEGDPQKAVQQARDLVNQGAVAIIGPVDSSSTEKVVAAGLNVPVLSSLSTAPSLTKRRDPWFFRATLSDDERIRQYVKTLRGNDAMMPEPRLVLYDGASPYGQGLKEALLRELGLPEDAAIDWAQLLADGSITDANHDSVQAGRGFTKDFEERLDHAPRSLFVLGKSAGATLIADGVAAYLHDRVIRPQFLFVGDDRDLLTNAPEESVTIGEPAGDANTSEFAQKRKDFARDTEGHPEDFVVTAYELSRYVLPQAIKSVVEHALSSSENAELPQPEAFRQMLREELETGQFASMEQWRRIKLGQGVLSGAPLVPVYRIRRGFELVEVPEQRPWLEVDAPKDAGFLAGSVTIHIRANGAEALPRGAELNVIASPDRVVVSQHLDLADGRTREISFYPPWPGQYRVALANLPTMPLDPLTDVHFDASYPLALLGALLGSLLFGLAVTSRTQTLSRRRIVLGVLTGLVLAGLALHRSSLPAGVPFPSFGQSRYETAVWAGLAGGWFGPGVLMLLIGHLLPAGGQPQQKDGPDRS